MMKKLLCLLMLPLLNIGHIVSAQSWSELGTGTNALKGTGYIADLKKDAAGNLYAAGALFNSTSSYYYLAKWNGTNWTQVGSGFNGEILSIAIDDNTNSIYVAGTFMNSSSKYYVAKYSAGSDWQELGSGANSLGANGVIRKIALDRNGLVYAAGDFTESSGSPVVAQWNGFNWTQLTGLYSPNGTITSLVIDALNTVYIGGTFKRFFTTGGTYNYIAQWNPQWGGGWAEVGQPNELQGTATSIAIGSSPDVIAALVSNSSGIITFKKWDGTQWTDQPLNGTYSAYGIPLISGNGNYYTSAYDYDLSKLYIIQYTGGFWQTVGTGSNAAFNNRPYAIALDSQGDIYTAGDFTDASSDYYVAVYGNEVATAIDNQQDQTSILLYPNPGTDVLHVNFPEATGTVSIYNSTGELILSQEVINGDQLLNMSQAKSGIYTVIFNSANGSHKPMRWVKQ